MKTTQTRRTLSTLTGLALLGAMMLSSGALDTAAAVLFYDPFTTADTGNINATVATRQSGLVAPVSYVGAAAGSISGNTLLLTSGGSPAIVTPNYNFTALNDYSISVDIKPISGSAWSNFIIGAPALSWHFGFGTGTEIFFNSAADGSGAVIDNGGGGSHGFGASASDVNGYWNLRLDISTGGANILTGNATVKAYVQNTLVASFTRTSAYTDNYVSLVTANPNTLVQWDNLQVTEIVPEPTAVYLLGLGGLIIGWRTRRLK